MLPLTRFLVIQLAVILLVPSINVLAQDGPFILRSKQLTIELSKQGRLTGVTFNRTGLHKPVVAYTSVESFTSTTDKVIPSADKKFIRFEHTLYSDSLRQSCTLTETFSSTANSIRWEMEITGGGSAFLLR